MKLIAYLLPQFHRIAENDLWWGNGFTEWTNVKKAVPQYTGHQQPRKPLDEYYYDLTKPHARAWQAETAGKFGIYGFCYYHYWFKGKTLLERPLQEVLATGEPDFPFCLSWANEPWTRNWDGMDTDVLMPQDYGDEQDWTEHFHYLLKAFRDKRYIRVNDKPMLLIYRPNHIERCEEMMAHWRKLAVQHGLRGLHLVQTLGGFPIGNWQIFDASVEFEPHYSFAHGQLGPVWHPLKTGNGTHMAVNYDQLWRAILERTPHRNGGTVYPGAFVSWDNTPRRGIHGQSTLGMTPDKLELYLTRQLVKARDQYGSNFVFINAWNEWAEGTFLEPDADFGDRCLRAVRRSLDRLSSPGHGTGPVL